MGYRTVVMLCNDLASEWEDDPELGRKIAMAMSRVHRDPSVDRYGKVVECEHGDTQTLAVLDGYNQFRALAHKGWSRNDHDDSVALALLEAAADQLGYELVQKSSK